MTQQDCYNELHRRFREKEIDEITFTYLRGLMDGMKAFAWWKDGVEYVGTCGTTLNNALEETVEGKK